MLFDKKAKPRGFTPQEMAAIKDMRAWSMRAAEEAITSICAWFGGARWQEYSDSEQIAASLCAAAIGYNDLRFSRHPNATLEDRSDNPLCMFETSVVMFMFREAPPPDPHAFARLAREAAEKKELN